ncbi:holo-ACP synthase [Bifidobacterium platyrrhinorum]|uniref:Holo-[acyl-carrier-protein] synthase n=1 Tax=Bifidobacterium platyrrhinorum TaxID=2661628 RepID=A0A6L9ST29_9BIFI|nr:4'-phosphopantetheinyl transferase superfamily protein [Bifidobacterium platyrrhinorum]NEG54973.1 4'-phosphopantetheinyl transferase superfamily protein [Bifidobacterium platyrrhinorum]
MPVLGLGHDVVDVAAFAEQLALPGSRMRALFSVRETRQAAARAAVKHDGEAVHLAAKWAGKEAVLKAWCEAVGEGLLPYTIDDFPWSGIEILDDAHGRPHVALRADVARALHGSVRVSEETASEKAMPALRWHVSLTHDAGIASAVALLES